MNFPPFEAWIKSDTLKDIALHWNEARQERWMPAWTDIRPSRIAAHLSSVWSFRYDLATNEFYGRLVGDKIARYVGKAFKDLPLGEAYPPEARDWARSVFLRVVKEPALYGHMGVIFEQMGRPGAGERIVLPLSSDGRTADGVLGATVLDRVIEGPIKLVTPVPESERWFPLAHRTGGAHR